MVAVAIGAVSAWIKPPAPLTASPSAVDVLTYHNDNARTGQNLNEPILTPANVSMATFGKVGFFAVDGKVDAQPLLLSGVTIPGQGIHDVLYVATEHDTIYGLDAITGAVLWSRSLLGAGESPSEAVFGCSQVAPEIGITSTPVINKSAGPNGVIYVVAMSKIGSAYIHRLHALDVTSGAELFGGPQTVAAPGFVSKQYEERSALLLLNGMIITSWTSHCDADPYHGWIMSYNASTLAQTSALNTTPNGSRGAYWMAGAGPAADSAGNIYLLAGNGTFDTTLDGSGFPSQGDFGNAFLKLSNSPALAVVDYFATFDTVSKSDADSDLGSGGTLVLPDLLDINHQVRHLAVGAGKDGHIYLADRDSMGRFHATPSDNSNLYQDVSGALPGGVWSMPAYFNSTLYYGPQGNTLKAFSIISAKIVPTPASQSTQSFDYPGTTPGVSASGGANAIVWAVESATSSPAVLHAYDALNLSSELYNSNQAPAGRDAFGPGNKFITPTIVNGRVYVGTPNGVAAFGLLGQPPPTVGTGVASATMQTTATIAGTANPNGTATTAFFQYGPTNAYGSATPGQGLGAGSSPVAIGGGDITGLACATLYHFRASATSAGGTTNGLDATFTTAACAPPIVTTGAAGPIHATGANIQATVNPNGALTTITVEYGLTTSYGSTSLPLSVPAGTSVVPVARLVSGLMCNTPYHYRVRAANASVTAVGADETFTSAACGFPPRTVLWRHRVTGQNVAWLMNGPALETWAYLPTVADLQWTIQATGDINGDGQEDIVWRHTATGQMSAWFLNGTNLAGWIYLPTIADPNWVITGLQDFDGDGKADLLWHNTVSGETVIWFLNGTGLVSWASAPTVADVNWEITGAADFNGDGKTDLLWRSKATGDNVIWLMNGATLTNWEFLPTLTDQTWAVSGVGDLDGDGHEDIVWRNTISGQNVGWFMNGATLGRWSYLPTVADPNWVITSVADTDGDGASDLVWRNQASGDNVLWQMNADQLMAFIFMPGVSDLNWELIGE